MRKIRKTPEQRKEELRQALHRLDGPIKRYREQADVAELGTVAIELRGLVCGERLLTSLAEDRGFPLEFYTIPQDMIDYFDTNQLKATYSWAGDSASLECMPPWTRKTSIPDWLSTPVAEIKGSRFTAERLINEVANTFGPAHYPSEASSALFEMSTFHLGGIPSHFYTLVKFGDVLIQLGEKFLASISPEMLTQPDSSA